MVSLKTLNEEVGVHIPHAETYPKYSGCPAYQEHSEMASAEQNGERKANPSEVYGLHLQTTH